MKKELTRREFLKIGGLTLLATGLGGALLKEWLQHAALAGAPALARAGNDVLVVIQLSGGNDGLNTVVPYT
ncbi:MAG: transcriptional initiation protein Tat, partial [Alicyclobacillus sp.]|nr:transcriptional initiation protein Tat [Alicyclobacillus sp.]